MSFKFNMCFFLICSLLVGCGSDHTPRLDVLKCTSVDKWTVSGKGEKFASLEPLDGGLKVKIDAKQSFKLRLRHSDLADLKLPEMQKVVVSVSLLSGEGEVAFAPGFQDADGEGLRFASQSISGGSAELSWDRNHTITQQWGRSKSRNGKIDGMVEPYDLEIRRTSGQGPVELLISAYLFHFQAHPSSLINTKIKTGTRVHILKPDEESKLGLQFKNPYEKPVQFRAKLKVEGYDRSITHLEKTISLAANENTSWNQFFKPKALGVYFVDYSFYPLDSETPSKEGFLSFAYMKPNGPNVFRRPGFAFGVNGSFNPAKSYGDDFEKSVEALSMIGINTVRKALKWEVVQNAGRKRWNEKALDNFDVIVNAFKDKGVEGQYLLAYNARWNAPKEHLKTQAAWQMQPPQQHPDGLEAWLDYVDKVLGKYSDRVRYWEVWNESDIWNFWRGTSDEYLELLRETNSVIKKHDPNHQTLISGFALLDEHPGHKEANFQKRVCIEGINDYDILAHHRHGHTDRFYREMDGPLAEIRNKLPQQKPLWMNETSTANKKDDFRYQASALIKKLCFSWSRGAMGYSWYTTRGGILRPGKEKGSGWGMFADGWRPKPVYQAYNTLIGLLDDMDFFEIHRTDPDRFSFSWKPLEREDADPNKRVIVFWNEYETLSEQASLYQVGTVKDAHLIDLMGNRTSLQIVDQMVQVQNSHTPRFLLVEGTESNPELLPPLIDVKSPLPIAVPGRNLECAFTLINPLQGDREIQLKWSQLPGHDDKVISKNFQLVEKENKELKQYIPIGENFALPYGDSHHIHLSYQIQDTPWNGNLKLLVQPAIVVPGQDEDREPDVVLDDYRYVNNRTENVPQLDHLNWQGPEDLSTRVWFSRENDRMVVRIDAVDDEHIPSDRANNLSSGDSVQLLIALPGINFHYQIEAARMASGKTVCHVEPPIVNRRETKGLEVTAESQVMEDGIRYILSIPYACLRLNDSILERGFQVNVVQIDRDDAEIREGWIQMARTIDAWRPTIETRVFPTILFAEEPSSK
ncbi:MAG: family 1 glycosylhydrolase [Verrucomicrobiota bacterium]